MTTGKNRVLINEDWTAVVIGALIIVLSIAGMVLPAPAFGWARLADLSAKVFSTQNLETIAIQFGVVYLLGIGGIYISGRPVKSFLAGFPLVYLLTMIALVITGNRQMQSLNLEAVIFALAIGLVIGNVFRLPQWLKDSLSTELFVKIGLVLLGTTRYFFRRDQNRIAGFVAGVRGSSGGMEFCLLDLQTVATGR